MAPPLLAVDAPSILYRSFFALPDSIKGADGKPVNALLGAANLILREVEERRPRTVVLCFGAEAAHYRVEALPAYHGDRPVMPPDLEHQWGDARDFFEAFGWIVTTHPTLEADDLLGSYGEVEAEAGGKALLFTGDRDMFQCATQDVRVLYLRTGKRGAEEMGPAQVKERYGIPPALVPDFIALRGDPSDGIPGAPGVGEKTAADLLRRHGSLEAVLDNAIAETKPKLRTTLIERREDLLSYKDVATLRDAEVTRPPDAPTDWSGAALAARARGMNRLGDRLEAAA